MIRMAHEVSRCRPKSTNADATDTEAISFSFKMQYAAATADTHDKPGVPNVDADRSPSPQKIPTAMLTA